MGSFLLCLCVLALLGPSFARGQSPQVRPEEELFFTYIGPVIEGGLATVDYKIWDPSMNERDSRTASGSYFSGGAQFDIFVHNIIGEFSMQFRNTSLSAGEVSAGYMKFATFGKYLYAFNERFFASGGFGIFMETGPSTKSYEGGGGVAAVIGGGYSFMRDYRILFDITAGYGRYGLAEEAVMPSYGVKLAVLYKIGRL